MYIRWGLYWSYFFFYRFEEVIIRVCNLVLFFIWYIELFGLRNDFLLQDLFRCEVCDYFVVCLYIDWIYNNEIDQEIIERFVIVR